MSKYSEDNVKAAMLDVQTKGISQREAATRWRVPRSTLQVRLKGGNSRRQANEPRQRLSAEQERHLVQWIVAQTNLGLAPTQQDIWKFVSRILKRNGDERPLGTWWVKGFVQRNPEVRSIPMRGQLPEDDDCYTKIKLEPK